MAHKGDKEKNQKEIEENLGDARGSDRDSGEAQKGGNQCNYKKSQCPTQHALASNG
jgi:hypothetical protein